GLWRPRIAGFCLLHGKWHDGSCWDSLAPLLRERGHDVVAPDMPFDDPATTFAQRIEPVLAALGDLDEPIVIVGHSLAAVYAPLVAAAHPVALVVYLCPAPLGLLWRDEAPVEGTRPSFPFPPPRDD